MEEETVLNKYLIEWINMTYPTMIAGGNSTLLEFDYYDADKFANWIEEKIKQHKCNKIISVGLTKELYCGKECESKHRAAITMRLKQ